MSLSLKVKCVVGCEMRGSQTGWLAKGVSNGLEQVVLGWGSKPQGGVRGLGLHGASCMITTG